MQREAVREYYGKVLKSSKDLKTSACCTEGEPPAHLRALFDNLHPEVVAKYYGCGLVAPELLQGCRVLDLGSGSGHDAYLLAQLVGPEGEVVGVDMTDEQLGTANAHLDWHMQRFGHARANVRFLKGYLEELDALGLEPESFDVIVSNCVVNLSTDKPAVLRSAHRLLKQGGEFYFSDVYSDRRLSDAARTDPELYGECLGGALYRNDFIAMAKACGFADPRLVTSRPLEVHDERMREKLGAANFFSATYRLFKLDGLEADFEDYGQSVSYRGGIRGCEDAFVLDANHLVERGKTLRVCSNTWRMLAESRFASHFEFIGDFSTHSGTFTRCGTTSPIVTAKAAANSLACC